jgi:hypothetical protein
MAPLDHVQLLGSTAHPEEASECYTAVWEQLAILARSTMYDPANLRMSGAYWPLTTACFLVSLLQSSDAPMSESPVAGQQYTLMWLSAFMLPG